MRTALARASPFGAAARRTFRISGRVPPQLVTWPAALRPCLVKERPNTCCTCSMIQLLPADERTWSRAIVLTQLHPLQLRLPAHNIDTNLKWWHPLKASDRTCVQTEPSSKQWGERIATAPRYPRRCSSGSHARCYPARAYYSSFLSRPALPRPLPLDSKSCFD